MTTNLIADSKSPGRWSYAQFAQPSLGSDLNQTNFDEPTTFLVVVVRARLMSS